MSGSSLILPLSLSGGGASQSGALVAAFNEPVPSPEVQRALSQEDERWFLKFSRFPKPHWDVCERWLENDPRRAKIRDGTLPIGCAFDVLCYCPPDIRSDEVLAYVRPRIRRVHDARRMSEQQLQENDRANERARLERIGAFREELRHQNKNMTSHEAQLLAGATTAHPMIQGADLTPSATPER